MNLKLYRSKAIANQQKGAVLVLSLIVLLVLTLMGVAGMNSSVMQERMSANSQNSNRTFQAAESAVGALTENLLGGDLSDLQAAMDDADELSDATNFAIGGDDMAATYQARYLGEIRVKSGSSMDANESTVLLKGYRYELIGTAEIAGTGASATILQGIEYY